MLTIIIMLCPWLTLALKHVTRLQVDSATKSFTLIRGYISTVHLFRWNLGFGVWFNVLGNLSKASFFLLVWCGKTKSSSALFVMEMYRLF